VKIILDKKADAKLLEELKPDVVVIATGSKTIVPKIPGVENAVIADDVLRGKVSVGRKVIVVGGGFVGIETALHLAAQGREVTVVEALPEIARDVEPVSKVALLRPGGLLEAHKVKVVTNATITTSREEIHRS
jgi:pyruvate/2-oxoglutarate dehydrogenase complex dihydrolipoamide dehydrogenase (E3) component